MGSSEFLYALLSTIDQSYKKDFSFKTKFLLSFCKLFFPKYLKISSKSRLDLKNKIKRYVKNFNPEVIIELGAGHSEDYFYLLKNKRFKELIQIDKEVERIKQKDKYRFIEGDITKEYIWKELNKIKTQKGIIIAEGLFSYLNDEEFEYVINNIKKITMKRFCMLTHEPLKPISFSRKIISLFIGKTYRRFNSIKEIKKYYERKSLKIKIINSNKYQVIYLVYK